MSAPQEIELKLLVLGLSTEAALQKLRRSPALLRRKARQQQLLSRYYDTPDHLLQQHCCALRLRQAIDPQASPGTPPPPWVQTLKGAGSSHAGLSQRDEWEHPVCGDVPEREALRGTSWDALDQSGAVFERLQPCYETRCLRTSWLITRRDGTLLEVTLDAGSVHAGEQAQPLLEIELELLAGSPQALFDLADELAQRLPCLPSHISKAERGQLLAQQQLHRPVKARRLELQPGEPLQALAQRAMTEMLEQFLRNLEGALQSDEPELVHQARVGWRRWRSMQRLLRPWIGPAPDCAGLRPLLDALGQQRNLDVACSETLPTWQAAWPGPTESWQQALQDLQAARLTQRTQLRQALATPAVGRTLLALTQHLWQSSQRNEPIKKRWARQRLARWHRRLQRLLHGEQAQLLDVVTLHAARLLAKRLRYGSEALASALPAKRLRQSQKWVQDATLWQTRIGQARDAWQAALLLQQQGGAETLVCFMQGVAAAMERTAQEAASTN